MTSFYITARKTSPLTPLVVEAWTREEAIAQVVATAGLGEEVAVSQCEEMGPGFEMPPVPPGATGATGTMMLGAPGTTGVTGTARR